MHIVIGDFLDAADLVLAQAAQNAARGTDHQGAVGDLLAFGHQSVGADKTVLADHGIVEHHGVDADEAAVADGAAVEHDLVADADVFAEGESNTRIGMVFTRARVE